MLPQLPLGQRFRFESDMTLREAREAARAEMKTIPERTDGVWGFAIGSLIFRQKGLVGNPPGLIAWLRQRDAHLEVLGTAGLNLGGLVLLATFDGICLLLGIVLLIERGDAVLLWMSIAFSALFVGVAWSNHVFRKDGDPLVHALRSVLRARDFVREDRTYDREGVLGAKLIIDGEARHENPSPYALREALLGLGCYQFLILSFAEEEYMQVLCEDRGFCLEQRQGSADQHYRATDQMGREKLLGILEHYLRHRRAPEDVSWERVDL